ncbi:hypothetical protein KCH_71340 [Kitasatospora cheerisanensis KCTC 2395]|uniref:Uncharacterized protein n=1 Tax=Kitasatospora cheerisanensis KCTC 2395 TaxID=1348663 RepID=A0A066YSX9_9ACTN|nr:hypothetical protein KCH_71340 [Kitasatospora cheerisanensis KCTC 2395]
MAPRSTWAFRGAADRAGRSGPAWDGGVGEFRSGGPNGALRK